MLFFPRALQRLFELVATADAAIRRARIQMHLLALGQVGHALTIVGPLFKIPHWQGSFYRGVDPRAPLPPPSPLCTPLPWPQERVAVEARAQLALAARCDA
jgi:hypothetical protein